MYRCSLFSFSDGLSIIADFASILTPIIGLFWFFYTKRVNYYQKEIIGNYKIFSSLTNDQTLCYFEVKINHVSNQGWFVGNIKYSETGKPVGAQSQGSFNVYGNINYGNIWKRIYFDLINLFKSQKKLNPFFDKSSYLYKGVLYILERNDFNPNKENWEKYLIKTYSLTHFRNSYRFHLKQINKGGKVDEQTQLPEELFLVNNDIVQDNMYDVKLPF